MGECTHTPHHHTCVMVGIKLTKLLSTSRCSVVPALAHVDSISHSSWWKWQSCVDCLPLVHVWEEVVALGKAVYFLMRLHGSLDVLYSVGHLKRKEVMEALWIMEEFRGGVETDFT